MAMKTWRMVATCFRSVGRSADRRLQRARGAEWGVLGLVVVPIALRIGAAVGELNGPAVGPALAVSIGYGVASAAVAAAAWRSSGVGRWWTLFALADAVVAIGLMAMEPRALGFLTVFVLADLARAGAAGGARLMAATWGAAVLATVGFMGRPSFVASHWEFLAIVGCALLAGAPLLAFSVDLAGRRGDLAREAKALAERREFLARVGHELRSPLQAIAGWVDLIEVQGAGVVDGKVLQRLRVAARNIRTQVEDLLTLARAEAGSLTVRLQPVELGGLVEQVFEAVQDHAHGKGLRLESSLPQEGVRVVTDPVRVGQVLENLITNALKYTDRGSVRVSVGVEPGCAAVLRVADTGRGILPADVQGIFAQYRRGADAGPSPTSAGVGLAVVRAVVDALGGHVEVSSRLGEGSTFTVRLPAVEGEPR